MRAGVGREKGVGMSYVTGRLFFFGLDATSSLSSPTARQSHWFQCSQISHNVRGYRGHVTNNALLHCQWRHCSDVILDEVSSLYHTTFLVKAHNKYRQRASPSLFRPFSPTCNLSYSPLPPLPSPLSPSHPLGQLVHSKLTNPPSTPPPHPHPHRPSPPRPPPPYPPPHPPRPRSTRHSPRCPDTNPPRPPPPRPA